MSAYTLIMLDRDRRYLELAADYVRKSEFASMYRIRPLTQPGSLDELLRRERRADILLAAPDLLPGPEALQRIGSVVLLTDSPASPPELDYPFVYKYQPVGQLMTRMAALIRLGGAGTPAAGGKGPHWYTVYAGSGGCGVTTIALHVAKALAARHAKVLYCPTHWNAGGTTLSGEQLAEGWARLFYALQSPQRQLGAIWAEYERRDPLTKAFYFDSLPDWKEWREWRPDTLAAWLDFIRDEGGYDAIVCDAGHGMDDSVEAVLERSDTVLWPLVDDFEALRKARRVLETWRSYGSSAEWLSERRLRFVLNKYLGAAANKREQFPGPVARFIPYIPEWKSVHRPELLLHCDAFQQSVSALLAEGTGAEEGGADGMESRSSGR